MATITDSARPSGRSGRSGVSRASAFQSNLNLTRELAVTAFRLKYTGSVLGYAWSLVNPLLVFGTTYFVFISFLLKNRLNAAENFPVQLLLGIVLWSFFSDATGAAIGSITANGHIIRKAYFPRWIVVVAATISASMTLAVNLFLILVIGIPVGWFHLGLQALLVIPLLVELYLLVVGVGLLLSALFVFYRDLGQIWTISLQLLFYGSAVVFPFTLIPGRYQQLVACNPMAQIVEDLRRALVTPAIPWSSSILGGLLVVPVVIVMATFVIGWVVFHRLSPRFGESL